MRALLNPTLLLSVLAASAVAGAVGLHVTRPVRSVQAEPQAAVVIVGRDYPADAALEHERARVHRLLGELRREMRARQ